MKSDQTGINLKEVKGEDCMTKLSHLCQQETYRRGCYRSSTDQGDHAVAVHGAVHLPVGGQHDPRRPEAHLADGAAAALKGPRHKQRAASAVALLEGTVLVIRKVVFGPHVARAAAEAEEAGAAVPPWGKEGSSDAEERLKRKER